MAKAKPIPLPLTSQDIARFWSKVDKTPGHGPDGDCWIWTASLFKDRKGNNTRYGRFTFKGKNFLAHRVSYVIATGRDPVDMRVLHRCDVMQCINPAHLWEGTDADNSRDMISKGRQQKGDHRKPENIRRGDNHPMRLHPELVKRGDANGMHRHPESARRGIDHHKAKLTEEQVREIRSRFAEGDISRRKLAWEFGVTPPLIARIINKILWKHIT